VEEADAKPAASPLPEANAPEAAATEAPAPKVAAMSQISVQEMESWKRKWLWTSIGGGTAALLSLMEGNVVKSANAEQKEHIEAISNDPLMAQSEYDTHRSAVLSAESRAKQAKTLSDLFVLVSAGLFGTAAYFYFHPPQEDSVAAQVDLLPITGMRGWVVQYQSKW